MEILCPYCNKNDQVQKVSSIFKSGTISGSYSGPAASVGMVGGDVGIGISHLRGTIKSSSELRYVENHIGVKLWGIK